jgi:flagellar biosynthesis GTPase FlhF
MLEKRAAVVVTSCLLAGLLTISSGAIAQAAECLSGPNAQSGPGTHWRYRINHSTGQRCWYLKRLGQAARSRPASESVTAARTPRSGASEPAAPAEAVAEKSSIRTWFSSTFSAFTSLGRSATNTEANDAPANDNSAASKQSNSERTEQKKSQQSKLEQQPKASQSKEKEKSDTARSPSRAVPMQLILEASGDKDVPDGPANLSAEEQKTAIEAVGDKDVFAPQTELKQDWQKELYEQFLEWRVKQLMFM